MVASPVPPWSRKRINLQEETGTGSSAKKARQDLHPHVSTDAAPADLKKGSDDGDSRAGSTDDSTEVATHVDAPIFFSDSNYGHGLGQVLASDLPSIAGVKFSEGVCPNAVVEAFAGGNRVCKNYSEMLNENGEPGDVQDRAVQDRAVASDIEVKAVPKVRAKRVPIVLLCSAIKHVSPFIRFSLLR
jgi:hypothetical protein